MSLFSKILKPAGKLLKQAVKSVLPAVPGPIGTIGRIAMGASTVAGAAAGAYRSMPGAGATTAGLAHPRLPAPVAAGAGRVITGIGGAMRGGFGGGLMKMGRKAAQLAGYIVTGSYIYDAAGNLVGRAPSRRMNPLNPRAMKRAIRRVKAGKKIAKDIEKLTGGTRRRASCAPKRRSC